MPPEKQKQQDEKELSEQEAEQVVYEALRLCGAFLPQTVDEVARAEAEVDEHSVELPPKLRDPFALLERMQKGATGLPFPRNRAVDSEAVENLAFAAKNGSDIPPEVLSRMDEDERNADVRRELSNGKK
jgi:hypothetical protein